jgi:hypothetical protein
MVLLIASFTCFILAVAKIIQLSLSGINWFDLNRSRKGLPMRKVGRSWSEQTTREHGDFWFVPIFLIAAFLFSVIGATQTLTLVT